MPPHTSQRGQHSPLYLLLEDRLETDGGLPAYIAANFQALGWRGMARDLQQKTGVRVSNETLRIWFADRITVEVHVRSG